MEATTLNNISITEYLSISQKQNQKYEFHDGHIFAMAGGTVNHGIIGSNFLTQLGNQLLSKNSKCFPLNSDIRLYMKMGNRIVYPDTMVVCKEIERAEADNEAIVNPTVVVEVLSKTTEGYDRGDKFYFYQQIPSLKEYILVAQDKKQIDIFKRGEGNLWSFKRYETSDDLLKIESIETEIPIDAIYRNVVFEV